MEDDCFFFVVVVTVVSFVSVVLVVIGIVETVLNFIYGKKKHSNLLVFHIRDGEFYYIKNSTPYPPIKSPSYFIPLSFIITPWKIFLSSKKKNLIFLNCHQNYGHLIITGQVVFNSFQNKKIPGGFYRFVCVCDV